MNAVELTFLVVAVLRAALYILAAVAALRLMRDLAVRPRRRRSSPAVHGGLMLLAGAGVGLGLLSVRLVLLRMAGESWGWFLLSRNPDLLGDLVSGACSIIGVAGVLLLIRGYRAVLFYADSGRLPAPLRPRGADPDETAHGSVGL